MSARRLTLRTLASLCALAAYLTLGVSLASAMVTHNYLFQFSEVPASSGTALPGPLGANESMTVDSGHVWIAEQVNGTNNSRVDKFSDATGAFISQFAHTEGAPIFSSIAIGHLTGEPEPQVYLAENSPGGAALGVYSESGAKQASWTGAETPAKSWSGGEGTILGVAVDNSTSLTDWATGDVYVALHGQKVIDVLRPEVGGKEKYVTQLTGISATEDFNDPSRVTVDSDNGDVIVLDGNTLDIFEPTVLGEYAFVGTVVPPSDAVDFSPVSIDANDGDGDIYVSAEVDNNGTYEVFEFAPTGAFLGKVTAASAPGGNFGGPRFRPRSVAGDPATHNVFIGTYGEQGAGNPAPVFAFGPNAVVPDVTTEEASGVTPASAMLHGTIDPDNEGEASCFFVWGTTKSFGQLAPCEPEKLASGSTGVPVHARLSGLQPDTTYYYRMQASNKNGTNIGESEQDRELTTPGPGFHGGSVSNVASSSATLEAVIDPHSAPTSYYFQYGASIEYGSEVPVAPGVSIGGGEGDVGVSQHLQGLAVGARYHYRVVAVSEMAPGETESFDGPDGTFATQAVGGGSVLPDGRAWEMVSPPSKEGAALESGKVLTEASVDGNGVAYAATAPTEENPQGSRSHESAVLLSSRGPDGWATKDIETAHDAVGDVSVGSGADPYRLFSSDLSLGLVEPHGEATLLSAEASEKTPYLRHDSTCVASPSTCYQPLVSAANVPPGIKFDVPGEADSSVEFTGATPDLSHIVLSSTLALTSTPVQNGLYEWDAGRLQLVSILPADEGGAASNGNLGFGGNNVRKAISDDGSRIVWTPANDEHIYVRDVTKGETIRLDIVENGARGGAGSPQFQAASSDGSKVFFDDTARLKVQSSASSEEPDLYEFDLETRKLTDLTVDVNPNEHADVQGTVLGAGEDGSYVYFVANGVLAEGAAPGDCDQNRGGPPEDSCNLYVSHAGTVKFIAALSERDGYWGGKIDSDLSNIAARVSGNGRWLSFMSRRSLTGYDNQDANSGEPDQEVFLYNADTERLVCASCNPSGARPVGVFEKAVTERNTPALLSDGPERWVHQWIASLIPGWTPTSIVRAFYQSRYLSNSGRLFFDSNDALTPRDTNGTWDVYEYEPSPGNGGCGGGSSESSGGCVGLISSGGSAEESTLLDASENGNDVFFLTASGLVPQDYDGGLDLYDARVCTGSSPCFATPPVLPPPCSTGDSCKAAPTPQPESFGAPSSETFSGTGNIPAPVGSGSVVKVKSLTNAQKLARALKACKKKKPKRRRHMCEAQAKHRYAKNAHKSNFKTSLSAHAGH